MYLNTVTVSPDGSLCASGGKDGKANLWDLTEGEWASGAMMMMMMMMMMMLLLMLMLMLMLLLLLLLLLHQRHTLPRQNPLHPRRR